MISKNKIKLIHSLEQKKYRKKEGLFVAEGPKIVNELLNCLPCTYLAMTDQYILPNKTKFAIQEKDNCSFEELQKASFLNNPQEVLAIFKLPEYTLDSYTYKNNICLALDGVQDPGNLGTILRIADWFGINHIYCSKTTADVYAPKTVQATMGAIARVQTHYIDLEDFVKNIPTNIPIYGTFLDGENIYKQPLENRGIIVMGNEGNGISDRIRKLINNKLFIPNYPPLSETSESLNVGVATAIICAEFRRRLI